MKNNDKIMQIATIAPYCNR